MGGLGDPPTKMSKRPKASAVHGRRRCTEPPTLACGQLTARVAPPTASYGRCQSSHRALDGVGRYSSGIALVGRHLAVKPVARRWA